MNQNDLLDLFNSVRDSYVAQAITSRDAAAQTRIHGKRIFLTAAAIALTALLIGCGIVYVLKMQNLKLGSQ